MEYKKKYEDKEYVNIFNLHSTLGRSQAMSEIAHALGKEVVAEYPVRA